MEGLKIECNAIEVGGKKATQVSVAVNGLSRLELANALEAMLQALVGSDEVRPAFLTALEAFVNSK